jgi:iron complex transport system substrate-binding protein
MRALGLLAALVAALALAACGSSDGDDAGTTASATGVEEGALPATVEHKYGTTTIRAAPKRVVVAGLREQDALLALGVVPVATTEWLAARPGEIYPWAKDELGDARPPTVLGFADGLQVERIAALRPDLIVAVYSALTRKEYETLSQIAPTIAQPPAQIDWGSSWQDEILMVGEAVGQPARAQRVKEETEALIARAAADHPEFRGQTAALATPYQGIYVFGPDDLRSRFLVDLGFDFPEELKDVGGEEFGGQLSDERVDLLDVGTLVWFADARSARRVRSHPVYRDLDVRKEGRDVFVEESGALYEATSFVSVLSIPLLIEEYVPLLAAAADGDPQTGA